MNSHDPGQSVIPASSCPAGHHLEQGLPFSSQSAFQASEWPDIANRSELDILVLSDTHRVKNCALNFLQQCPEVNLILHLGDHVDSLQDLRLTLKRPILGVSGNNDSQAPWNDRNLLLNLAGHRLFMTHGHIQHVRLHLDELLDQAVLPPNEADIVLFGHTHEFLVKQQIVFGRKIWLINPGSAQSLGFSASAIHLQISRDQVIFNRLGLH